MIGLLFGYGIGLGVAAAINLPEAYVPFCVVFPLSGTLFTRVFRHGNLV